MIDESIFKGLAHLDYKTGKKRMMEIYDALTKEGYTKQNPYSFCPDPRFPDIIIRCPGGLKTGDYAVYVGKRKFSHAEICEELYQRSQNNYEEYRRFLEEVFIHGTTLDCANFPSFRNPDKAAAFLFWMTLQENINYPPENNCEGYRLPFCRYFEAVYMAKTKLRSLEEIKERCNNHGKQTPDLYTFIDTDRPVFYFKN